MLYHRLPRRRIQLPIRSAIRTKIVSSPSHGGGYWYSTTSSKSPSAAPRNPRWLSEIQTRLGKCIQFGLRDELDIQTARRISEVLGSSWKGLVAGAEGFSVEPAEKGLPDPIWPERVLWGEMDSMGHVNNAHYLRYAETSRIWYARRLSGLVPAEHKQEWDTILRPIGLGLILKSAKVEYLLPLQYPDSLSLIHSLAAPANDAPGEITFRCWMLSHNHQRVAARVEENVPLYDYKLGKKALFPPWLEKVLSQARAHEEASREYWTSARLNIESWLRGLEDNTINSGKQEDMGGSPPAEQPAMAEARIANAMSTAQRKSERVPREDVSTGAKPQTEAATNSSKEKYQATIPPKPTWGIKS